MNVCSCLAVSTGFINCQLVWNIHNLWQFRKDYEGILGLIRTFLEGVKQHCSTNYISQELMYITESWYKTRAVNFRWLPEPCIQDRCRYLWLHLSNFMRFLFNNLPRIFPECLPYSPGFQLPSQFDSTKEICRWCIPFYYPDY